MRSCTRLRPVVPNFFFVRSTSTTTTFKSDPSPRVQAGSRRLQRVSEGRCKPKNTQARKKGFLIFGRKEITYNRQRRAFPIRRQLAPRFLQPGRVVKPPLRRCEHQQTSVATTPPPRPDLCPGAASQPRMALTTHQKNTIGQFVSLTGAGDKIAQRVSHRHCSSRVRSP